MIDGGLWAGVAIGISLLHDFPIPGLFKNFQFDILIFDAE
jgi:hypothetical protein